MERTRRRRGAIITVIATPRGAIADAMAARRSTRRFDGTLYGFGMRALSDLFTKNRAWAEEMRRVDPGFFDRLSRQQAPQHLWIGCSDSRVPANQIVGLLPGEMFVHRNVANVVVHTDLNCLSVLQFAVDVLRVSHVIVCGHYGCGGVLAALRDDKLGLIDNWLRHVRDVRNKHRPLLDALKTEEQRHARLCELNVIEQVAHVCETTVVRDAWLRGQPLAVHGWIYGIRDGLLRDLGMCVTREAELSASYTAACMGAADPAADGRAADVPESVKSARDHRC